VLDSATGPWKFRVDHVYVHWSREDSHRWRMESCALTGPRIVANGHEGVQRGELALNEDHVPEWLAPTLDTHRPTRPDPCRHDKRQEPKPCRCNQFVACCDVDMDEHVEALMNVDDGADHGER
jgi:hypothetical protein